MRRQGGEAPSISPSRTLTRAQVVERAQRFYDLVARERELQEFLVTLRISGEKAQVSERTRQNDEALAEIRRIRMEGIVPIVAELCDYLQAVEGRRRMAERRA